MDFILIVFGSLSALLLVQRVLRHLRERRIRTAAMARIQCANVQRPTAAHLRVVWVEPTQLMKLLDAGADLVLFRLIDHDEPPRPVAVFRGELPVTLHEFEQTVPWIPMDIRIGAYRGGGIDSAMARQIALRAHGREVLLLRSSLPLPLDRPLEMAGDLCSYAMPSICGPFACDRI